ncbi:calcium/proton exchanger [Gemmatimonadetes bacterium T265]|nr:calcium/proton exchanger [Gemmatimonadetes bacterium T265]
MLFLLLLLLVPAALALAYLVHAPPLWTFAGAALAIVPLAEWIRRATEQLARVAGAATGGLLNITFGNAAELILALFVLAGGHQDVVKAQITGSIIGNSLLALGIAIVIGSWGREHQTFTRERAGLLASLLMLSVFALLVPALFDSTERGLRGSPTAGRLDERLSLGASVVLILVYAANLAYTLVTHRDVFAIRGDDDGEAADRGENAWPVWRAIAVLVGATAAIAWMAKLVSDALEATAGQLGLTPFFLGVVVLAILGNAAEFISAGYFARQDRMGLVMSITVGSSTQVALFMAPALVIVSRFTRHPMNLVFRPLELVAIAAAAFTVNAIAADGETTWFEGVLLIAGYALLALAFFFVTP